MKKNFPSIVTAVLACFLFQSCPLFAANTESDSDVVKRETTAEAIVSRMSEAAQKKQTLEKARISFEDILKDPDNVDLNFQFAKQQVQENDLLGAVGTLERVLAVRPELHEIRLFYAVVLFRLDNLVEAEREFDALENVTLSSNLREEWKRYRREIKLRKKSTRISLRESVGYELDSNRNAAPSSKQLLFADTRINNTVENRRRVDSSFLNITNLDVTHDLGFQAGHQLIGSFTYYLQNQQRADNLDLGSFQYALGGVYKSRWFNFTPTFEAGHVYLSDENYLRSFAGNFLFDRAFTTKLRAYFNYRIEYQDFLRIRENDVADQRTGYENSFSPTLSYSLMPTMNISGGFIYTYKNAKVNYEGYDHYAVRAAHSWLLGKGQFLINSVEAGFDRYDEQDAAIATRFRRDQTLRYRATYGAPLTFFVIGKFLPSMFKDIVLSASYEYYRAYSNVTNYTYTNHKFQALLTKKWEF